MTMMGWFTREVLVEPDAEQRAALEQEIEDLKAERARLKENVENARESEREAKNKLKDAEAAWKRKEEDIAHAVALSEERQEVKLQGERLEMTKEKQEAIQKVRDEFTQKMEERLAQEVSSLKDMYEKVLARLPDVNARLNLKGQA